MRRLTPVFVLLAVCLALLSCSESNDVDGDAAGGDTGSTEPADDGDTSGDDGDTAGDAEVAAAVGVLEDQGLSNELAQCAVDALIDQGIAPSELSGIAFPDEDLMDALALAGAECAEFIDGLPAGAIDLDDPAVRNGFITSFAASSGLSEEVAECVLDFLIDSGVDAETFISGSTGGALDPELQAVVQEGVTACS
jgi:hypothetical protein